MPQPDPRDPAPNSVVASLKRALVHDAKREIHVALQVAVLQAMGYRRAEIQEQLSLGLPELRGAEERLRRAGRDLA